MGKHLCLILALGMLAGCHQVGNKEMAIPGRLAEVQEGKTTKDEVVQLWGEPREILRVGSREEAWVYYHGRANDVRYLKVEFDGKGVVRQVYAFDSRK